MNIIVAVDKNWTIGCRGKLLYQIPLDMSFFKTTTTGKVIVVGRKTLESFPNKAPLPNRLNIILSKNLTNEKKQTPENAAKSLVVNSIQELFKALKNYPKDDIYIVGGEMIYRQLLPYTNSAYVTKINAVTKCQNNLNYFENLDNNKDWELIEKSPNHITNNIEICFCKYKNLNVKPF